MTNMKHYTDVVRLGHKTTVGVLQEGDHITIQEKLDGANASFRLSEDGKTVLAFSRNTPLDEHTTLRGFYNWVQENVHPEDVLEGYIYFGEWLVKHKIDYGEAMNKFYLYDLYDVDEHKYEPFERVKEEASEMGLNLIPVFYEGPYVSFEHLQTFVGKSVFAEQGEGIVVKNPAYTDKYGNQMFVKLVTPAFAEVQKQKLPKDPSKISPEMAFVKTFVTQGRVEKFLHKFVDEGILDENFGIEDMGTILRNLNPRIHEDLLKEEADSLPEGYDEKSLTKSINSVSAVIAKEIIANRKVAV